MQITHCFAGPAKKGAAFHGWAGPITEWAEKSAPKVTFGEWKRSPTEGGSVTFECRPFQLCMYGANSSKMAVRDKFTYFAFVGLGADGQLRLQRLPEGTDAREIFAAGGWTPPSTFELVGQVTALVNLDFSQQLDALISVVELCNDGYGLSKSLRLAAAGPSEKLAAVETFVTCLTNWPQLSEVAQAISLFLQSHIHEREGRRANAAAVRKAALEQAVSEMRAARFDVTPIRAAAWMMDLKEVTEPIPHAVKEKARKLKKEFADFFGGV
ncbi:hypothetical protein ACO0LB_09180 [Undibacterium sp. SXout7W]|uniref:hypothetical protein n=1 Tax=Undibacterium sp. SXout7W TaxID=3413049 RepID=UPI003BEFABBA